MHSLVQGRRRTNLQGRTDRRQSMHSLVQGRRRTNLQGRTDRRQSIRRALLVMCTTESQQQLEDLPSALPQEFSTYTSLWVTCTMYSTRVR